MAILSGLFSSKKDKRKADNDAPIAPSIASDFDTLDAESVAGTEYDSHSPRPNPSNSVYSNAGASSSKLKLPFRKKKSILSSKPSSSRPPQSRQYSTTRSEAAVDSIRPPPTRSAIFGIHGASPSSYSTHSLPNVTDVKSDSHDNTRPAPTPATPLKKSGNIFAWARERKKSKAPPPPSREEIEEASFNLKSFRHVRNDSFMTESPLPDPSLSAVPPVRPRPRGDSVASESSQRISVAAFREMQARRSAANSPTPSASRSTPIADNFARAASPISKPPPVINSRSGNASLPREQPQARVAPQSRTPASPSSTESDTSPEEPDSDDQHLDTPLRAKQSSKAKVGRGSPLISPQLSAQISNGTTRPRASTSLSPQLSAQNSNGTTRPRASTSLSPQLSAQNSNITARPRASTTLSPQLSTQNSSGTTRPRASTSISAPPIVAVKQDTGGVKGHLPQPVKRTTANSDTSSSHSDSQSDDDAPLASLVQVRRPGSAMSTSTNKTMPPKPLIDINSLKMPSSSHSSTPASPVITRTPPLPKKEVLSPTNVNDRLAKVAQGIGLRPPSGRAPGVVSENDVVARAKSGDGGLEGRGTPPRSMTLPELSLGETSPGSLVHTSTIKRSAASPGPRANTSQDNFPSSAGTKSPDSFFSSPSNGTTNSVTGTTSATSFSSFEKVDYSPPTVRPKRTSLCLDDTSDPIIPTPIHHRAPVPRFAVTSRPPHQYSQSASILQQPESPTSDNRSSPTQQKSVNIPKQEPAPAPSTKPDSPSRKRNTVDFARSVFSSLDLGKVTLDFPQSISESEGPIPSPPQTTTLTVRMVDPAPNKDAQGSPPNLPPVSSPTPSSTSIPKYTSTSVTSTPAHKKSSPLTSVVPAKKNITTAPFTRTSVATTANSVTSASTSSTSGSKPKSMLPSSRPQPTLISMVPDSPTKSPMPLKPFALSSEMRRYSPASSIGDSSSGRGAPVTPRDGSDIGSEMGLERREAGSGVGAGGRGSAGVAGATNMDARKIGHRKIASYDDKTKDTVNGPVNEESRRRERRRNEAKNAIDLGNVMNKPIRLNDDDEDERHAGMGIDPRLSMFNPLMGMNGLGIGMQSPQVPMNMTGTSWFAPPNQGPMLHPFMMPPPPNTDPHFLAAHQQAMMVAKQAYQYAVAQQAMAAAADEWERGSSASMMGGGGGGWSPGVMFPSGPRSMYAGSIYGGSDIGGPTGGGWGSSSVYGGSFGPAPASGNRSSMMRGGGGHSNMPPRSEPGSQFLSPSGHTARPGPRPRTKTAPSDSSGNGVGALSHIVNEEARARGRTPPPPSSWKRRQGTD